MFAVLHAKVTQAFVPRRWKRLAFSLKGFYFCQQGIYAHQRLFLTTKMLFASLKKSGFVLNKQHFGVVLIFDSNWNKSGAEAHQMAAEVYHESAPTVKSCRDRFQASKVVEIGMRRLYLYRHIIQTLPFATIGFFDGCKTIWGITWFGF